MKTLALFVALLAGVWAVSPVDRQPIRFPVGQTYLYEYTSRVLSGIPSLGEEMSGMEIRGQLVIQSQHDNLVQMKLAKVRIGKHNGLVNSEDPLGNIPQMNHQIPSPEVERELQKTIRFVYQDGKVKAFEAEQSEQEWSLNIKKSILSLWNVNLTPKKIIKATNEIVRSQQQELTVYPVYEEGIGGICETVYHLNRISDPKSPQEEDEDYYHSVLNVTKTRNYENCLTEPQIVNDNYDVRGCPWVCRKQKSFSAVNGYYWTPDAVSDPYHSGCQCGQQPHDSPVDAFNYVKYNISLLKATPTIEQAFSLGEIIYNNNGDQIVVKTQQNLTLIGQGVANVVIAPIQSPQRHQELSYRLGAKQQLDIPYYSLFGEINVPEIQQLIPELLESITNDVISGQHSENDVTQKSVQLVNSLAVLPSHALLSLYEQLAQPGQGHRATQAQQVQRKLFLDALPLAGSNNIAIFIKNLILSDKVSTFEAKELIESVPQNLFLADISTLDAYLELFQSPKVQSRRHLYSSAGIAFGKLVKESCVKRDQTPGDIPNEELLPHVKRNPQAQLVVQQSLPVEERVKIHSPRQQYSPRMRRSVEWNQQFQQQLCSESDISKYVQIIGRLLDQSATFHKKVTLIETLAHMGVPHALPLLEPYISGDIPQEKCPGYVVEHAQQQDEECDFIRQVAIYSLAHITEYYPKQVLPLLLPVYDDVTEPYELRIAAFTTMVFADADKHLLTRIAQQLHRENNRQVRSFVAHSLQQLANITVPCFERLSQNAQTAQQMAPQEHPFGYQYSQMIANSYYNDKKHFGLYTIADWVANNVSRVPRSAYFSLGQSNGPFQDELFQIGFQAKGMETLLERILSSNGLIYDMFEGMRAKSKDKRIVSKRSADSAQMALAALKEELISRTGEEPKATLFYKLFDRTSYYAIDKHYIHSMIDSIEDSLKDIVRQLYQGQDYHYVKLMMPSQLFKVLPSEVGLPVVVSHRHPTLVSLKINQAKLSIATAPNTVYPIGGNISAQITPSLYYSSQTFVFVVNKGEKQAIGTHVQKTTKVQFPVEISVGYSRPKNLVTWSFIPKVDQEVVFHKTQSQAFIAKTAVSSAPSRDWLQDAKEIKRMAVPLKHETTIGQKAFGLGFRVQLESENPFSVQNIFETEEYKEEGVVSALISQWRNPGLTPRELHVQLESDRDEPVTGYDVTMRYKWIANEESNVDSDDSDQSSESSESDSDQSDESSASKSSESKSSSSQSKSSSESKSSKSSEESNESELKRRIKSKIGKVLENSQKRQKRNSNKSHLKETNESSDESSNESGSKSWSKSGSKESSQSSSSESNSSQKSNSKSAKSSESSSSSSSQSDESNSLEDLVFNYEDVMKLILGQEFQRKSIKRATTLLLRKTSNIWQNLWDEDYDSSSSDQSQEEESKLVPQTISHDVAVTAVARGPRPSYYAFNVLYVHTFDHRIQWLKTDGHVKTPEGVYVNIPTLFCADAVVAYPVQPSEFYYWSSDSQQQKARVQAQLGWGEQCHHDGGILLAGVLETTEDHVITPEDVQSQDGQSVAHLKSWYFQQCELDRANGQPASYACERAIVESSFFNQMVFDIKYKNVSKSVQNFTEKANLALKVALYPHLEINNIVDNPNNQIRIVAQYSQRIPQIPLVNLLVKTPNQNQQYSHVHTPYFRPVSSLLSTMDVYRDLVSGDEWENTCTLMEDYVRTFDNVTYKLVESACQHILAKDCSPKERFTVFEQQLDVKTKTKTITVLIGGLEVKLLPPLQQTVAQIVVNGHTHEITHRQPFVQSDTRVYLRATPSQSINPIIVFENREVLVKFDGKNAKVIVDSSVKGRTCGLCGDNNDEQEDEFVGPDMCVYDHHVDFVNSYALAGLHCEQKEPIEQKSYKRCPKYNKKNNSAEESQEVKTARAKHVQIVANVEEVQRKQQEHVEAQVARQGGKALSPEQKKTLYGAEPVQQKILQRLSTQYISRDDMICFTTKPVLTCVSPAQAQQYREVPIDFHCLPKSSPFTQQLIVESETQIIKQLVNKRVDLRQQYQVPVACL